MSPAASGLGGRDAAPCRRLRAFGFRSPVAVLRLGLCTLSHLQSEHLGELAGVEDFPRGRSFLGQRETRTGPGDQLLLVHLAQPEEKVGLLSDGYAAYAHYAEATGLTHAQCWAHTRRKFFEAQPAEPEGCAEALDQIGALYAVEAQIREKGLKGENKRAFRLTHAKPLVERFFAWVARKLEDQGLLPSNPFSAALAYARERRWGLEVFLGDPEVPIDTNHLERALRAIPMGRKAWLFCWTEVGAKYVGIVQSLLTTCRLHGIDPYDYLVDVLQRVALHPAAQVADLTPRRWKTLFAERPMRSVLYRLSK